MTTMEGDTRSKTLEDDTGISRKDDTHYDNEGKSWKHNSGEEHRHTTTVEYKHQLEHDNRVRHRYYSERRFGPGGVAAKRFFMNVRACSEVDSDRLKSENIHVFTDGCAVRCIPYTGRCERFCLRMPHGDPAPPRAYREEMESSRVAVCRPHRRSIVVQ